MRIIIEGTPEECKEAIKKLAEKEKEFVPIYPHYDYDWWKPYWMYQPTVTTASGTGATIKMEEQGSTYAGAAPSVKSF